MTFSATLDTSVPAVGGCSEDGDHGDDHASLVVDDGDKELDTYKARMVTDLEACGRRLRDGGLVAFPTETVYGLGCNVLDEMAVHKVFEAKERPLSDPLIVHVLDASDALDRLWDVSCDSSARRVLEALCRAFWPGPLTLVAPASDKVPPCVTAHTGFVACRSPSHAVARELLRKANVPLGAPSANKFGHVSPTTALHVWDDLRNEDVWIVTDATTTTSLSAPEGGAGGGGGCDVGVESTVAKVEEGSDGRVRVQVLRQGKVSAHDLQMCLSRVNLPTVTVETIQRSTSEHAVNVAPGQTLRHYSPNVPSFLVATDMLRLPLSSLTSRQREGLQQSLIIDYGGRLAGWKGHVHAYRDLSSRDDSAEAARGMFEALRWAEQQPVSRILFPDLPLEPQPGFANQQGDALFLAVKDRLTRAASGVVISTLDDL